MDHSATRPHSQQELRDLRYAPIPPPPFSARPTSARPEILHNGDLFFQRRVETSDPDRNSIPNQPYGYMNNRNYASPSTGLQAHEHTRRGGYGPLMQDRHNQLRQHGSPLSDGRAPFPSFKYCIRYSYAFILCCALKLLAHDFFSASSFPSPK